MMRNLVNNLVRYHSQEALGLVSQPIILCLSRAEVLLRCLLKCLQWAVQVAQEASLLAFPPV